MDTCPITTRQLESLIRLTEARARLELREHATRQDAEDVIEIVRYMANISIPDYGCKKRANSYYYAYHSF